LVNLALHRLFTMASPGRGESSYLEDGGWVSGPPAWQGVVDSGNPSIPAYSPGSALPICRLARRGVVGGVSDLLGEDVCVTGVAGDFSDHAEVDEAQAYCAYEAVLGGVVEGMAGGDFI